jgi:hypothetical protein
MSKLLIDEQPVLVLPKLAEAIGLNEAIILQQINYWLVIHKKANKQSHFRDGRWWVYNTAEGWQENFPWWSIPTIRRTLTKLRDAGFLLASDRYNKMPQDRTLWYTINYETVNQIDQAVSSEIPGTIDQNDQLQLSKMITPLPETNTETTLLVTNVTNCNEEERAASPALAQSVEDDAFAEPEISHTPNTTDVIKKAPQSVEYHNGHVSHNGNGSNGSNGHQLTLLPAEKHDGLKDKEKADYTNSTKPKRKPTERQTVTATLEEYFLEITGLPEPPKDYPMLQKRWWQPLWYIYETLADKSVERAKRLIRAVVDHLKENHLTFDAPASLIRIARSLYTTPEYGPRQMAVIA